MFKRISRSKLIHGIGAVIASLGAGITSGAVNLDNPNLPAIAFLIVTAIAGFAATTDGS